MFKLTTASSEAVFFNQKQGVMLKNPKFELLRRLQRQYHRNHTWRLNADRLYVPHSYAGVKSDSLSSWDDVGFILNDRRVIVWWRHPRHVYADMLDQRAWDLAGEAPAGDWLLEGSTPNYIPVGKSRKRIISHTCRSPSAEQQAYYEHIRGLRAQLDKTGIDYSVRPTWKRTRLDWADGVDLVAPMEVRNEFELAQVAKLARRLMLGQTTLELEFPGYAYGQEDWLADWQAKQASFDGR